MKWSGSKDSQSDEIIRLIPSDVKNYFEPFLGGGSVFLKLLTSNNNIDCFYLSDLNESLIQIYNLIKTAPDKLINSYVIHHKEFNKDDIQWRKDYFAAIRTKYNQERLPEDFYFIMRTTTNGMPRYNHKNEFNNSCHFSRAGMHPSQVEKIIRFYSEWFNKKQVIFYASSYEKILLANNSFLYLDPPYENTGSMYFGNFNNKKFIEWVNGLQCKWILSYDGTVNGEQQEPQEPKYKRKLVSSGTNSSFRRLKEKNVEICETIFLNY